jgi:hypothetical protein
VLRRRPGHRHHHREGLAVLLATAALAGCGGDEDDPDEFAPLVAEPASKVQFLRAADRICHASEARIEAAADELIAGRRDPKPAAVERVALHIVVPALEGEVKAIRALGAPAGDEHDVEAILAATDRGIARIERDPRGLLDGVPAPLREAERLARRYGSQECGFR